MLKLGLLLLLELLLVQGLGRVLRRGLRRRLLAALRRQVRQRVRRLRLGHERRARRDLRLDVLGSEEWSGREGIEMVSPSVAAEERLLEHGRRTRASTA